MAQKIATLLTDEQQKFLTLFNNEKSICKKFYLTGGTALTEFYLHHRLSEDLDFFSEEEFPILPIRSFIKKVEIILKARKVDYQNFLGLHTFFFHLSSKDALKVDFNYYPFPRISNGIKVKNIMVDSDYDIG
ncbi:MAG: nucleotidyl transferase AbiEii/AbiGii toxin family protein, partial [Candidatus Omnitrophica bacterium]|nr:nucleotidyl transferase AbiEii/AbiGii toxin family protein [Candidatus Omnitrophota bacterium]